MSGYRAVLVILAFFISIGNGNADVCDSATVAEGYEPIGEGEVIYNASRTDIDIDGSNDYIKIENGSFITKVELSLDNDTELCKTPMITVNLKCGYRTTTSQLFYFNVIAVNNFAPVFSNTTVERHIQEGMPNRTVVLNVPADNPATDKDCNDLVLYRVVNNEDLAFKDVTEIVTNRIFDYEAGHRIFSINVTAQDQQQPTRSSDFVFSLIIDDVDDESPAFRNNSYNLHVSETPPAQNKEWLTATPPVEAFDKDLGINAPILYSIPDQTFPNLNPNITINDTDARVLVDGELDRESVPTYHIIIKATQKDNKYRTATTTLTLHVDDTNDNRPQFHPVSYNVSIQEHTAVSVNVIRVTATDADQGNNSMFTYFLTSELEVFDIDRNSGYIRVKNSTALDRETQEVFTINVKTTEQEPTVGQDCSEFCTATVTVNLIDINDHTPEFSETTYTFAAHNSSLGEAIGSVSATDKDFGENARIEYSIPDLSIFDVEKDTGVITQRAIAMGEQRFLIHACDCGSDRRCDTAMVIVTVPKHNVSSTNVTVSLMENVPFNTTVYIIPTEFSDYILKMLPDSGPFLLGESPNLLKTTGVIDRETTPMYSFPINVSLANKTQALLTIEIKVLDQNDNAPNFNKSSYSFNVGDGAKEGDVFGVVTAYDIDEGDNGNVTYYIQGHQSSQYFEVNEVTGQMKLKSEPDQAREYTEVVIVATDNGSPSLTNTTAVKVFVGQIPGLVRFFAPAGKDDVENDKDQLISDMSAILNVLVNFNELRSITSPYGPSCAIYLTATHGATRAATSSGAVKEEDLRSLVEDNHEQLLHLFAKYQRSSSSNENPFTLPVIILIAVAAVILLVSVLIIALMFKRNNRYRRQARLAGNLNRDSTIYDTQEVKLDVEDEVSVTGSLATQHLIEQAQTNGTPNGFLNHAFDNDNRDENQDTVTQYTHVEDDPEQTAVKEDVIVDISTDNNPEQETGETTPNPDYLTAVNDNDAIDCEILPEPDTLVNNAAHVPDDVEPDYLNDETVNGQDSQVVDSINTNDHVVGDQHKPIESQPPPPPPPPPLLVDTEFVSVSTEGGIEDEEDEESFPPPPPTPPRVRKTNTAEEEEVDENPEDEPEPDYAKKVRFNEVKVEVIPDKEEKDEEVEGTETDDEETNRERPVETITNPADDISDDGSFLMTAL